jgi:hypothetical protein
MVTRSKQTDDLPETHLIFEKLGDINATLREVKHETKNNSQKIDGLAQIVATQGALVEKVDSVVAEQKNHHLRLAVLEADKHRREGAIGLVAWFSRHWPFTLLAVALAAIVSWANGKIGT